MQWLRAVVPNPHGNAAVVEKLADIVGVNACNFDARKPHPFGAKPWAQQPNARYLNKT